MAEEFRHSVSVDGEGRMLADGASPLDLARDWTPEHLVLAALVRCTLASLVYSAERAGVEVAEMSGAADGVVSKRAEDGRYAFLEVECGLDIRLSPRPADGSLTELLDWAERGCFVGASLTAKPRYEWRVNGELVGR